MRTPQPQGQTSAWRDVDGKREGGALAGRSTTVKVAHGSGKLGTGEAGHRSQLHGRVLRQLAQFVGDDREVSRGDRGREGADQGQVALVLWLLADLGVDAR